MRQLAARIFVAVTLVFALRASVGLAETHKVSITSQADDAVEVQSLRVKGDIVQGVLANKSSKNLRDVRLVIRHAWLWKNERNPGTNNPGRAEFFAFPGEITGGGSAPFQYRLKAPPPPRGDGKFITSAEVMSYTLVGR